MTRDLAAEVPLSLTFNGVAHVVMLVTPADLRDFVIGFSLAEEIIAAPEEILSLDFRDVEGGILAAAEIPKDRHRHIIEGRRNLVGQSGCGICGVVELEHALRPLPRIKTKPLVPRAALFNALEGISAHQSLNRETGTVHAAAFADAQGTVIAVREDVGRHNAFDKLTGHMAQEGIDPASGFVLLTSRCSHELTQKAIRLGVPLLATISAPTTMAVDMARAHDLTLVALARSDNMLCFNDPHGIF